MSLEEKDKKISDLRALLTQAKAKIEEYKGQLVLKVFMRSRRKKRWKKYVGNMIKVGLLTLRNKVM